MVAHLALLASSGFLGGVHMPASARQRTVRCSLAESAAYLGEVPQGAPDAILGIAQAFRESTEAGKVNLAVGAYRDDGGVPFVLPSVREAEQRILARGEKKEYAPIVRSFSSNWARAPPFHVASWRTTGRAAGLQENGAPVCLRRGVRSPR
jgi:aspartate/tyrosine/aromatic aminotransferase